jgi:hypothetical protein
MISASVNLLGRIANYLVSTAAGCVALMIPPITRVCGFGEMESVDLTIRLLLTDRAITRDADA